jgi:hypothetical protein
MDPLGEGLRHLIGCYGDARSRSTGAAAPSRQEQHRAQSGVQDRAELFEFAGGNG